MNSTDPCSVVCRRCETEHHIDAGGTQCRNDECRAFLPEPTDRQARLFAKRLEQTALHGEGYVTVGGYIDAVHGGDR